MAPMMRRNTQRNPLNGHSRSQSSSNSTNNNNNQPLQSHDTNLSNGAKNGTHNQRRWCIIFVVVSAINVILFVFVTTIVVATNRSSTNEAQQSSMRSRNAFITRSSLPFSSSRRNVGSATSAKERMLEDFVAHGHDGGSIQTQTHEHASEHGQDNANAQDEADANVQSRPQHPTVQRSPSSQTKHQDMPAHQPNRESPTATFSICLLLKDDNDLLPEWLAYHWHTLKMRHLVVAIDPSSKTSPNRIFDQWRRVGLNVTTWSDQDFMPDFFLEGRFEEVPRMIKYEDKNASRWNPGAAASSRKNPLIDVNDLDEHLRDDYFRINNHRYRQSRFLTTCTKHLQDANLTWMVHIDTDEYVTINPTLRSDGIAGNVTVPTQLTSGSVLLFLERLVRLNAKVVNWPCISLPRLFFGSVEDTNYAANDLYRYFDRERFETLRWKYHADYQNAKLNKLPKVIMDVSGFPHELLSETSSHKTPGRVFSIHRPNIRLCRKGTQMNIYVGRKYPLLVHHYIGSLQRYQARDDPRRSIETYNAKALVKEGRDDKFIETWLPHFVNDHGLETAMQLMSTYTIDGKEERQKHQQQPQQSIGDASHLQPRAQVARAIAEHGGAVPSSVMTAPTAGELSLCLLLNEGDTIEQVAEWVAWHYHSMKLTSLVVSMRPNTLSQEDLEVLFAKWRRYIQVDVWSDGDVPFTDDEIIDSFEIKRVVGVAREDDAASKRRRRVFAAWIQHSRTHHSKSWVSMLEVDQFINLHPLLKHQDAWRKMSLDEVKPANPRFLFEFLRPAASTFPKGLNYPCISMPQIPYGYADDDASGDVHYMLSFKQYLSIRPAHGRGMKPLLLLDMSALGDLKNMTVLDAIATCKNPQSIDVEEKHKYLIVVDHFVGDLRDMDRATEVSGQQEIKYEPRSETPIRWIDGWLDGFRGSISQEDASSLMPPPSAISYHQQQRRHQHEQWVQTGDLRNVAHSKSAPAGRPKEEVLSACSLVKDDNDILDEWIAYHYHVVGLRHLIVAVDTNSKTQPTELLQKWKNIGMTIEEWDDHRFMPDFFFEPNNEHLIPRLAKIKKNKDRWIGDVENTTLVEHFVREINRHRFRQSTFVTECTKALRNQQRTWMIHIDTDEYLTINPVARKLGYLGESNLPIPKQAGPGVILDLLNQLTMTSPADMNYPCVSLPRVLFGSVEDAGARARTEMEMDADGSDENAHGHGGSGGHNDIDNDDIFKIFDKKRFETLRWKYHTSYDDESLNKQPKVIMDISQIPDDDKMFTDSRVFSIHRPSMALCRTQGQLDMERTDRFPFSVNHYLGTYERFSGRDDLRRNRKIYDAKSKVHVGKDDGWMDSWLKSFVESRGVEEASLLLQSYSLHH